MDQELQDICALQIRNGEALKKVAAHEMGAMTKMGALFCTAKTVEVNLEKIQKCREILKRKAKLFSNFRGNMEFAILVKMSLEDDPETYLERVFSIYDKLKEGQKFPGEFLAMAAITINERSKGKDTDQVIADTREAYQKIKRNHKFLTDEALMPFIVLMVTSEKELDDALAESEELFQLLKSRYQLPSDAAQSAAMVLALSSQLPSEKAGNFMELYETLKLSKHATSKHRPMSIYAAFSDLSVPRETLAAEIGEVDAWLKEQKGYGAIAISGDVRKVIAAALVLQKYELSSSTEASAVISQVIVEEVLMTVLMLLFMI